MAKRAIDRVVRASNGVVLATTPTGSTIPYLPVEVLTTILEAIDPASVSLVNRMVLEAVGEPLLGGIGQVPAQRAIEDEGMPLY